MEGLEAVEIRQSELNEELRVDSQYFQKRYLYEDARRRHFTNLLLGAQAFVTDGPHGYHEVDEASPIAMLTAKCAKEWFATRTEADTISADTHNANLRSSLEVDDLILSTRGTVGLCAIVEQDVLPSNIDQDVARVAVSETAEINPRYLLAYLNSCYGQDWITRNAAGMVQQGLSLAKVRQLPIPLLSQRLQELIAAVISDATGQRRASADILTQAEQTLLAELGLADWAPPEPLAYSRSSRHVLVAGRFDSQFHAPRVQDLIKRLSKSRLTIGDVAPLRKEYFAPKSGQPFDYIEIGDVSPYGEAGGSRLDGSEAPSRATWIVHDGDVITSTVRPNRRLSAMIQPEQNGFVCSSGFAVLNPQRVPSEVMLTYLRLPLLCELMDLHTTATMYPAIAVADLLALPFAPPSAAASSLVVERVQSAKRARDQAGQLLDRAKHAVEIAIENGQAAALRYLEGS